MTVRSFFHELSKAKPCFCCHVCHLPAFLVVGMEVKSHTLGDLFKKRFNLSSSGNFTTFFLFHDYGDEPTISCPIILLYLITALIVVISLNFTALFFIHLIRSVHFRSSIRPYTGISTLVRLKNLGGSTINGVITGII